MTLVNFVELGPRDVRQGRYLYTEVEAWHCGDDYCDCAQVLVLRRYENPLFRGATWPVRIWEGKFWTDGEGSEERKRDLVQAFHDIRIRFPLDKFGTLTFPKDPENYPADHRDDEALRALAVADPSDPNTPLASREELDRTLTELRGWTGRTPLHFQKVNPK